MACTGLRSPAPCARSARCWPGGVMPPRPVRGCTRWRTYSPTPPPAASGSGPTAARSRSAARWRAAGRRAFVSGKKKQNTIKFTKISDERGRTLADVTFRPGRMHDQTALRTDGIDHLLEQFPDVRAEMDAGYRGLHRDHPDQVSVPPKKPAKDAGPEAMQPGSRPATPSHRRGSAWSTPSPAASTGGHCSAGSAGARTWQRQSRRSARWCPTAPLPGNTALPPITQAPRATTSRA